MCAAGETTYLMAGGKPVLSKLEVQSYAYGLPEAAEEPEMLLRWMAAGNLEVDEAVRFLEGEATRVAASSDESLEVVRLALDRLEAHFPGATR